MSRYNVKVVIPIINKTYEVFVPSNILVGNFLYMLLESINDLNSLDLKKLQLYNMSDGEMLNLDDYIFNVINNGISLILV